MTKPVTGLTTFGSATSGTTTQLDNNFTACTAALNDFNTYNNYLADTGGANAYAVSLPASATGTLTAGLTIQFKASAVNTGASTFNYNGGGAKNILRIDGSALVAGDIPANGIVQVQYDGTQWLLQTPYSSSSIQSVPVRQTVLNGPMNSSGYPTLVPSSCTSLTLNTSNISASAPLVVAAANGFSSLGGADRIGYTTGNLSWQNLAANAVNFLAVVVSANGNMTTTFTNNAPVYQWGGSNSTVNGNYTFNIQAMQMAVGNGTASAQTFTVFVGEANCNSNAVVSAVSYAYMARYTAKTACPNNGSTQQFNHNIGLSKRHIDVSVNIEAITLDSGAAAGEVIDLTNQSFVGAGGRGFGAWSSSPNDWTFKPILLEVVGSVGTGSVASSNYNLLVHMVRNW